MTSIAQAVRQDAAAPWLAARLVYLGKLIRAVDVRHPLNSFQMVRAFRRVSKFTGVDVPRLKTLWTLAKRIDRDGIPGDVVECGVWNGGTAALMGIASRGSGRHLWLFDSFKGFPKPTEEDLPGEGLAEGDWTGSLEGVLQLLAQVGTERPLIHVAPGWFQETIPASDVRQIALLHLDADLYDSVKLSLEHFYDRVQPGGFVVLDDYGFWPGCRAAFHEFAGARGFTVNLHVSDETGRWFQKPR